MGRESRHVLNPSAVSRALRRPVAVIGLLGLLLGLLSFGSAGSASAEGYQAPHTAAVSLKITKLHDGCYKVSGTVTSDSGKPPGRIDGFLDNRLVHRQNLPSSGKFSFNVGCARTVSSPVNCGSRTNVGGLTAGRHTVRVDFVPSSPDWQPATASSSFVVKAIPCNRNVLPTGVDAGLGGAVAGPDHSLRLLLDALALMLLASMVTAYRRVAAADSTDR